MLEHQVDWQWKHTHTHTHPYTQGRVFSLIHTVYMGVLPVDRVRYLSLFVCTVRHIICKP
jgi:hypothetical protein